MTRHLIATIKGVSIAFKDEHAKKDEALKDVSQLVGKVLADVTAEAQRRHKAEQLRLLAEAEVYGR